MGMPARGTAIAITVLGTVVMVIGMVACPTAIQNMAHVPAAGAVNSCWCLYGLGSRRRLALFNRRCFSGGVIMTTQDVFTTGQAAKIIGLSIQTVIRRFDSGDLAGYRLPHGFRRITRESLIDFIARHQIIRTELYAL